MVVDYPDWQRGIRLVGSDITLNINIEAFDVTLDFNFKDQSVAVFDAAKWFAHRAKQVFVEGDADSASGAVRTVASREVPSKTTFFVTVMGGGADGAGVVNVRLGLYIGSTRVATTGGVTGDNMTFDTPVRVTEGQIVSVGMAQWSDGTKTLHASFGGYDEIEEE